LGRPARQKYADVRCENRKEASNEEEDPPPAEHVREATARNDQHAEHQRVAVVNPLHSCDVGSEVLLHCRERDAQGGEVVSDDKNGQRHRDEAQDCRLAQRAFGLCQMLVSVFEPLLGAKTVESERIGIGRMRASAVRRYPSNLTFRLKGTAFFAVSVSKRFETRPDIFCFFCG
jgi:hypothetical protein